MNACIHYLNERSFPKIEIQKCNFWWFSSENHMQGVIVFLIERRKDSSVTSALYRKTKKVEPKLHIWFFGKIWFLYTYGVQFLYTVIKKIKMLIHIMLSCADADATSKKSVKKWFEFHIKMNRMIVYHFLYTNPLIYDVYTQTQNICETREYEMEFGFTFNRNFSWRVKIASIAEGINNSTIRTWLYGKLAWQSDGSKRLFQRCSISSNGRMN